MALKPGDKSKAVTTLQHFLKNRGFIVKVDGTWGKATTAAVKAYEAKYGKIDWDYIEKKTNNPNYSGKPKTGPGSAKAPPKPKSSGYTPPKTSPLPKATPFTPPTTTDPDETLPDPVSGDDEVDTRPNAKAELRRVLSDIGLGTLADIAWELYAQGMEVDQILVELENTEHFRARFPGIRDATSGEKRMSVGEYLEYERTVQSMVTSLGFDPLKRWQLGALIEVGRSPAELKEDLDIIWDFKQDGYKRKEFYAYTGIDPNPEGLFALALGLAPDLQAEYDRAVQGGVSREEFFGRLGLQGEGTEDWTLDEVTAALRPQGSLFQSPGDFRGDRMTRLQAIKRAELAAKAQFASGGHTQVEDRLNTETF